jgi:hypothetical protein
VTLRAAVCAALAAALLCTALPARAEKETIALDYQVGAGCPDRSQFVARVHTFTTKAEIVSDGGAPLRKFGVQVLRAGSAVRGELTIDDRGAKTTRQVSGATCDEVISALALATAIAVDPGALGGASPDETSKPPVSEPAQPPDQPKPHPARPSPAPLPERPKAPVVELPQPPMLYLAAGARLGSANSIAPFPKLEGTVELGFTYLAPLEFYVGGAYGPKQEGRASIVPDSLRVSEWLGWLGAGYRLLDLEPFSVLAETAFELGQVEMLDLDVDPQLTAKQRWLAVDVGLSGRLNAPGPLFFQANMGARAPLLLQGYDVQDMTNAAKRRQVYRVEQLGYLFGLSIGVHFL